MALASHYSSMLPLAIASLAIIASFILYVFSKPTPLKNVPAFTEDSVPLLGSPSFFTKRWEFFKSSLARSKTGNFTFYAGQWPVIALSGERGRKVFFESKHLSLGEGYGALLAGAPAAKESVLAEDHGDNSEIQDYILKRIVVFLKGPQLKKGLPQLLLDARADVDALVDAGSTDPFVSIYGMIFHFTMRTLACVEIANDSALRAKVLSLFESIEGAATSVGIMFPWVPTYGKTMRSYWGAKLYMIFKKIVDDRNKTGRREDDALQFLMDQGDSVVDIITFVLRALFAGQINSGVNASFILCYLATNDEWMKRVRHEVDELADKYNTDKSLPLKDRLMTVPLEAWDNELPNIDLCLREVIRMQLSGTAFRRNQGPDIVLTDDRKEVIPRGAYAAYAVADTHYDPNIYKDPLEWDPSRYLPDRAEDKKAQHAYLGWGVARHPCLGVRFAKLENNLIVAFFLAYFEEIQLTDAKGNRLARVPDCNINHHGTHKPDEQLLLKYKLRAEAKA